MKVITKTINSRIIHIGDTAEEKPNGIYVGEFVLADADKLIIYEVETVPDEVVAEKYCYNEEDGFYLNNEYIEPIDYETRVSNLEEQIEALTLQVLTLGGI
jgi:hypothetical protein